MKAVAYAYSEEPGSADELKAWVESEKFKDSHRELPPDYAQALREAGKPCGYPEFTASNGVKLVMRQFDDGPAWVIKDYIR